MLRIGRVLLAGVADPPLTNSDGRFSARVAEGTWQATFSKEDYLPREISNLTRELEACVAGRKQYWKPDFSSPEAYTKSVQPNRERLKKILGVVDPRVTPVTMEYGRRRSQSRRARWESRR